VHHGYTIQHDSVEVIPTQLHPCPQRLVWFHDHPWSHPVGSRGSPLMTKLLAAIILLETIPLCWTWMGMWVEPHVPRSRHLTNAHKLWYTAYAILLLMAWALFQFKP